MNTPDAISRSTEVISSAFKGSLLKPNEGLCGSKGDEAESDVAAFAGRHWGDIDESVLLTHYNALYWFTPAAFCYYLPAFLACGLRHPRSTFVVSLIQLLRPTRSAEQHAFRVKRWGRLNTEQVASLQTWLETLELLLDPSETDEVISAIEVVSRRYWWAPSSELAT